MVRLLPPPHTSLVHRHFSDDFDPIAAALLPPADEGPQQRAERERREAEAKRVSDEIDEMLRTEQQGLIQGPKRGAQDGRREKPVKVLLLGQSESGECCVLSCADRVQG